MLVRIGPSSAPEMIYLTGKMFHFLMLGIQGAKKAVFRLVLAFLHKRGRWFGCAASRYCRSGQVQDMEDPVDENFGPLGPTAAPEMLCKAQKKGRAGGPF